jgi:UDP-glucose 4-epimerase
MKKNIRILITGSSGYIGSCLSENLKKKFIVFGIDKNKNSITKQKKFFRINLLNYEKSYSIIKKIKPNIIIHLAAQSTIDNIHDKKSYLKNNIDVTKKIVKICEKLNINKIIFSSTAALYKNYNKNLTENSTVMPNNIYGKTKLICEKIIKKKFYSNKNYIIFRFFNVCSSMHPIKIGENHSPETHFIPIVFSKFLNNQAINIYGNTFSTKDRTCIRDYIHIKDIVRAIESGIKILFSKKSKSLILNLGSGVGHSNLEIINYAKNFFKEHKYKNKLKCIFARKRKGDLGRLVCSLSKKTTSNLKWFPKNTTLKKIFTDELKWRQYLLTKKIKTQTIY